LQTGELHSDAQCIEVHCPNRVALPHELLVLWQSVVSIEPWV
jgi:hypothetical protein